MFTRGHIHIDVAQVTVIVNDTAPQLEEILELVHQLLHQEAHQMAAIDTVLTEVTETRGQVDSLIALVTGLSAYIRDNVGNEDALLEVADQLDSLQSDIAAAVAANPLPGEGDEPPAEG